MAARKNNKEPEATKAPEEEVKTAPESDTVEANNEEKPKEEPEATKAPEAKVYEFTSENKYLTVSALGIQFVGGKASTTNLGIARELAKISGVSLVDKE